jgi:hypothetical protein
MRFVTASEHRQFFIKRRFVEFENLISSQEAAEIKKDAESLLAARLKMKASGLQHKSPLELFLAGRDLWRHSPLIKKIITKPKIGAISSDIFEKTPLRLAYDQLYFSTTTQGKIFEKPCSLQQTSCLKNITGGLILRLSDDPMPLPETEDFCPFPQKIGSGIFLSPEIQLSFDPFFCVPHHSLLLIVYCGDKTVYTLDKKDPFTHALKRQGYVFGDRITSTTHPIVYR